MIVLREPVNLLVSYYVFNAWDLDRLGPLPRTASSYQNLERHLQRRHPVSPPQYGLADAPVGPLLHLAGSTNTIQTVATPLADLKLEP